MTQKTQFYNSTFKFPWVNNCIAKIPWYFFLGVFCVGFSLTSQLFELHIEVLDILQKQSLYKQISGFGFAFFVLSQWYLAYARVKNMPGIKDKMDTHKLHGVLGPVLFLMHASNFGFGYQLLMSCIFLGNTVVGLLNVETLRLRKKWFVFTWTIVHVMLAVLVLFLMFFHIYVVYAF